jgi:hypothetical protein
MANSETPVKFRNLNRGDVVNIPGQTSKGKIVVVGHEVHDGNVVGVDLQVQPTDSQKQPGAPWPITVPTLDETVERVV